MVTGCKVGEGDLTVKNGISHASATIKVKVVAE